jgi:hypothetical protein
MNTIYTAEESSGDLFMVAAWEGIDRPSFKEFVLENLSRNSIPEPDRNIQDLSLCEWEVEDFVAFWLRMDVPGQEAWKNANFATLYWTYPGVWSENRVTRMPAELAAEFGSGEGIDRDDPHHPDWHDTMAGIYDNREKGA